MTYKVDITAKKKGSCHPGQESDLMAIVEFEKILYLVSYQAQVLKPKSQISGTYLHTDIVCTFVYAYIFVLFTHAMISSLLPN